LTPAALVNRPEAVLEEVCLAAVSTIEPQGKTAVERSHPMRDLSVVRFEHQVIVVRHQAIREAVKPRARDNPRKTLQKVDAV